MANQKRYSAQVRERAVRMVGQQLAHHETEWAAIRSIANKIGCTGETLSSTNLVTDENLLQRFDIQFAGCSSHARRPFALYEDADPIYGPFMLDQFRQLSFHERTLDQVGRNRINVQAVRENDSKSVWVSIKEIAETVKQRWSRATPLGTAARYILKHFEKLTAYLRDPRLAPTNNLRERLLRTEKLSVPTHEYLVDILKTDPAEISAHPERYTPHAWKQRQRDAEMAGQDTVD